MAKWSGVHAQINLLTSYKYAMWGPRILALITLRIRLSEMPVVFQLFQKKVIAGRQDLVTPDSHSRTGFYR